MKIYCKSNKYQPSIPSNLQVNKIGKYLYNNIDGAFKYSTSSNTCDVYFTLLYQIPYWDRIPGKGKEYNDMHEMIININLTTYQNKIRLNILEMDPNERTLGSYSIPVKYWENLDILKSYILDKVNKSVVKAYSNYDFLF